MPATDERAQPSPLDIWALVQRRLGEPWRPCRTADVEVARLTGPGGQVRYMLKQRTYGRYLPLTHSDYFVWNLLDGTRTLDDLSAAFLQEFGTLGTHQISGLLRRLRQNEFLTTRPIDVFASAAAALRERSGEQRAQRLYSYQLLFRNLDPAVTALYRWFARPLFTLPGAAALIALAGAGLGALVTLTASSRYSLLGLRGSYSAGIAFLAVMQLVVTAIHEAAHALAVKHYRREVREGGAILQPPWPTFFVNTNDMWMVDSRRARLLVSWVGPFTELVFGGACLLAVVLWPGLGVGDLLYKTALVCYAMFFINMNPLFRTDGYYLLSDSLGLADLRGRASEFVRRGLIRRLRRRRRLDRTERLLAVYGIAALVWGALAAALYLTALILGARWVRNRWDSEGLLLNLLLVALSVLALAPLVFLGGLALRSLALRAAAAISRSGVLGRARNVAALGAATAAAAIGVGAALPGAHARAWYLLAAGVFVLVGTASALVRFQHRSGGAFGRLLLLVMLTLVGAAALDLLLATTAAVGMLKTGLVTSTGGGTVWPPIATALALTTLVGSAHVRVADEQTGGERAASIALVAGSVLLTVPLAHHLAREGNGLTTTAIATTTVHLALLSLALLVPVIGVFRGTAFWEAWLAVAVASLLMGLLTVTAAIEVLPVGWAMPTMTGIGAGVALHVALQVFVSARIRPRELPEPATEALTDSERLAHAAQFVAASVLDSFTQSFGQRRARLLEREVNTRSIEQGLGIVSARGRVDERSRAPDTLTERARRYEVYLGTLVAAAASMGNPVFVRRALQAATDALYWEERELLQTAVFAGRPWAADLTGDVFPMGVEAALTRVPLFAPLTPDQRRVLRALLRAERYRDGEVVVREGDTGDRFYVVVSGQAAVIRRGPGGTEEFLAVRTPGDSFGEVALLEAVPRTATVSALGTLRVLTLTRDDYRRFLEPLLPPEAVQRYTRVVSFLQRAPFFQGLDGEQIAALSARLQVEHVEAGATVVRQGEMGDRFYLIRAGEVSVWVTAADGATRQVARLGPGEFFGEVALIHRVPRTATVRAESPVELLTLDKETFTSLVVAEGPFGQRLERFASRRLRQNRERGLDPTPLYTAPSP